MSRSALPKSLHSLQGLNLINLAQLSAAQIEDIVQYAYHIKYTPNKAKKKRRPLLGKSIALLFTKPSTRTRLSICTAVAEDGGSVIDIGSNTHLGVKETLSDTIRTVSQFCHAIAYRGVSHQMLEDICYSATIPVINALTTQYHPTQALADLLTIYEHFGRLSGVKITYIGDCDNNVARSLALAAVQTGMRLTLAAPSGYQIDRRTVSLYEALSPNHKYLPVQTDDPQEAVRGADVLYTDVWSSMGNEAEKEQRDSALRPYQVSAALLAHASTTPPAIFMHCLPANRGDEVVDEVIDGTQSVVWQQAGNRKYIFQALLRAFLRERKMRDSQNRL